MSASPRVAEPPSQPALQPPSPARFVIGRDRDGHWIAVASNGLGGGIFRSRQDAVRYALSETLRRPDAITLASEQVEFRM